MSVSTDLRVTPDIMYVQPHKVTEPMRHEDRPQINCHHVIYFSRHQATIPQCSQKDTLR